MALPGSQTVENLRCGAAAFAGKHMHMVGIGGEGMRGLAELLNVHGAVVSGSDCQSTAVTDRLERLGIKVASGHRPRHVSAETAMVVISAAIKPDNPEVIEANSRGTPVPIL